jgi:hypothetical protein
MNAKEAVRVLLKLGVGDMISTVRENEGKGWEGPKVKAWSDAIQTLQAYAGKP